MEKFYEKFDSYLNGELQGDELNAFEKALQDNPVLQQDLRMYREVEERLQHHFDFQKKKKPLKDTLTSLNKAFFQEEKKETRVVQMKPGNKYLKWAVAAAVLLMAGFFIPRLFTAPTATYANLIKMPTASFTEMSADADQQILATAEAAFNNKNYTQVVTTLKPYVEGHPNNATTRFYLALAYIETDHFAEANTLLKQLKNGDSAYATESLWYLALLELKRKNNQQFQNYLKQIPKGSGHYEQAKKLLK